MSALFTRLREVLTAESFHTFPSIAEAEAQLRARGLALLAEGKAINGLVAIIDQHDPDVVRVLLRPRQEVGGLVALVSSKWKLAEGRHVLAWLASKDARDVLRTITNDTNDVDLSASGPLTWAGADRPPTVSN